MNKWLSDEEICIVSNLHFPAGQDLELVCKQAIEANRLREGLSELIDIHGNLRFDPDETGRCIAELLDNE